MSSKITMQHADLFALAADGHLTLPARVVGLRKAAERLRLEQAALPGVPDDPRPGVLAAYVDAAGNDQELPSLDALPAREAALRELKLRARVLTDATTLAEDQLASTLSQGAEEIAGEHLGPAVAELWEQAVAAVAAYPAGASLSDVVRSGAGRKSQDAWLKVEELATKYDSLRSAYSRLALGEAEIDGGGEFSELRNRDELWSESRSTNLTGRPTPPWPEADRRARLEWLARHGAQPWCPTPDQRDARWREVHGEPAKWAPVTR